MANQGTFSRKVVYCCLPSSSGDLGTWKGFTAGRRAVSEAGSSSAADVFSAAVVVRAVIREWAAIRIQTAFRAFLARREFRALKGAVRLLQALVCGRQVRQQAAVTLRCLQALVRVKARRVQMSMEGLAVQTLIDERRSESEILKQAEEGWYNSQGTLEEVKAELPLRQEGAVKRERAIAYALAQQRNTLEMMYAKGIKANPREYVLIAKREPAKDNVHAEENLPEEEILFLSPVHVPDGKMGSGIESRGASVMSLQQFSSAAILRRYNNGRTDKIIVISQRAEKYPGGPSAGLHEILPGYTPEGSRLDMITSHGDLHPDGDPPDRDRSGSRNIGSYYSYIGSSVGSWTFVGITVAGLALGLALGGLFIFRRYNNSMQPVVSPPPPPQPLVSPPPPQPLVSPPPPPVQIIHQTLNQTLIINQTVTTPPPPPPPAPAPAPSGTWMDWWGDIIWRILDKAVDEWYKNPADPPGRPPRRPPQPPTWPPRLPPPRLPPFI